MGIDQHELSYMDRYVISLSLDNTLLFSLLRKWRFCSEIGRTFLLVKCITSRIVNLAIFLNALLVYSRLQFHEDRLVSKLKLIFLKSTGLVMENIAKILTIF